MTLIINVVLPVFAILGAGYFAGRLKLVCEGGSDALNGFVYYFALPILLFKAMAQVDAATVLNGSYIGAYLAGQAVTFGLGIALAWSVFKLSLAEAASHGTVGIYGNVGYMGIPLVLAVFGEGALPPVVIATIINAAFNIAVLTIFIETGQRSGQGGHSGRMVRDVIWAVSKNPILVAPILGFLWALLGAPLPQPLITFGSIFGAAAGPCALFAIGLFLVRKPLSEGRAEVASMTALKLLFHPIVTFGFAWWLLRDQPQLMAICVLMAALPTGANLFILVQRYGVYVTRTSTAILASTVLSVATLSVFFLLFEVR